MPHPTRPDAPHAMYFRVAITIFVLNCVSVCLADSASEPLTFFENEVRPVLSNNCYECHSARAKKLKANLRVDSLAGMLRGGDSGPAIEPGKPDESLLVSAIHYQDFEMPPSGKLSAKQIAAIEKWISMGAPWPDEPEPVADTVEREFDWQARAAEHWCWQPILPAAPPRVQDPDWPANPIDHFILAKLEAAGLPAAAAADKRSLIRRLYFDLIGLPPTPAQITRYLNDDSDQAYERLVDELLDSPHYGEKWTRHWLDLVRYGETLGHEFDYPLRHAYRYRDYVIRAFNRDVPYDQFVHEHVAGDLLDPPRLHPTEGFNESIIGTGFWYLGEACHAPTDVRQDEADRIDNQIDVFSKTFLGLTVACARCHDHKFDPIPTQDYYALYGYIQSSRRQEALLDRHGQIRAAREELEKLNTRRRRIWKQALPALSVSREKLRQALLAVVSADDKQTIDALNQSTHPLYALAKLSAAEDVGAASRELLQQLDEQSQAARDQSDKTDLFVDFGQQDLGDWYITGQAFARQPTVRGDMQSIEGVPFARMGAAHSGLYGTRLRGVLRSPTFVLPKKRIHYKLNAQDARIRLIVDGYTMDEFNALLFNDVEKKQVNTGGRTQWITQAQDLYHYVGHRAHIEIMDDGDGFVAVEQIRFSDDANPVDPPHPLNGRILRRFPGDHANLLSGYIDEIMSDVGAFQSGTAGNLQIDLVNWLIAQGVIEAPDEAAELAAEMATLNATTPAPTRVIALADGDAENEYVFVRGNHKLAGDEAPRRLLVAIAGEDQIPDPRHSGRLDLARKLTAASNQLTSRVMVNRLWHHLFGRGIVPTVDDFGKMGQPPSHPNLLDWLAYDFMTDKQWSIKRAIKQIVMSRTYQMSTRAEADEAVLRAVDPDNLLLHRAPVRRLTAEAIRDSLLQLSGRLDTTMFGPSVPQHLTPFMEGRGRPGKSGPRDGDGRRSLYIEVRRNFLSPMMMTFDRPSPFSTMGRRSNSNVPAQSLMLMNDPFVVSQSKLWAKRIMEMESQLEARVNLAFEMAYARPPSPAQLARCEEFLASEPDETKAWADLCHMLVNMKPFIFLN